MKNQIYIYYLIIIIASSNKVFSQDIIFLHHSVGEGVYLEGDVGDWFYNYNNTNSTNYNFSFRYFPNTPYPWDNYPYDYWNLWVNNACDNSDPDIECLSGLCADYDVIIFKHCYPGASIIDDEAGPVISSPNKTLDNYKVQYRAIRDSLDAYPDNKFIVWTLAPLHRLVTSVESAARARQFVNWVKNEWLTEDGREHPNISIFDFFGYTAESDPSPANGQVNCLKYEFEYSHTDNNSHPNTAANEYVGPLFAQFIVDVIENVTPIKVTNIVVTGTDNLTVINSAAGTLQMDASIEPLNVSNSSIEWSVESLTGNATISENGLLTAVSGGDVKVIARALDGSNVSGFCIVTIINQSTTYNQGASYNDELYIIQFPDILKLKLKKETTLYNQFSIYTISGVLLLKERISENLNEIDISAYPSGVYILSLSGDQSVLPLKFIKP